jgi:hypothetical protein
MTVASRLTSTGTLFISGEFDEVTGAVIKLTTATYFAAEFDEITLNPLTNGITKRETSTGTLMVAGEFNEVDKPI